jgi:hypothetical protein
MLFQRFVTFSKEIAVKLQYSLFGFCCLSRQLTDAPCNFVSHLYT